MFARVKKRLAERAISFSDSDSDTESKNAEPMDTETDGEANIGEQNEKHFAKKFQSLAGQKYGLGSNLRDNLLQIKVYFRSLNTKTVEESPRYSVST